MRVRRSVPAIADARCSGVAARRRLVDRQVQRSGRITIVRVRRRISIRAGLRVRSSVPAVAYARCSRIRTVRWLIDRQIERRR